MLIGTYMLNVPNECATDDTVVWKLKKCVYGLVDASRNWFLSVKKETVRVGMSAVQTGPCGVLLASKWSIGRFVSNACR